MLRDLNELANTSMNQYRKTFVNEEFKLKRDFKERFAQVLESHNTTIKYYDYTAEITLSSTNKIFCPNQWFYIATFAVEFCSELIKYKGILVNLSESDVSGMNRKQFFEKVKNLKGKNIDDFAPDIKEAIINYFNEDETSAEYLCRFLTEYSWWFGSKTIDRHQDYYNSPVLSLLGLVAVSQGYIADIVYYMASDQQLLEYSRDLQVQGFRKSTDSTAENLIVYGAPGTGKSRYLEDNFSNIMRVVFHSEYSYYDFVGSYKPTPLYKNSDALLHRINGDVFELGEPFIDYQYIPGPFIKILIKALRNPNNKYTLLIEEINRANAPTVFGDIFQLLDRKGDGASQYKIEPNEDLKNYLMSLLDIKHLFKDGLFIPENMSIVATMNSGDQGVYVLDSAFKRRWKFKYMPIKERGFVHEKNSVNYAGETFEWRIILTVINSKLKNLGVNEDRLLGPFFISPEEIEESNSFTSKLLIYLWDDVVRYKRENFFASDIRTYSDLVTGFVSGVDVMNIKNEINKVLENEQVLQANEVEIEQQLLEEELGEE
ncbi:AAA family ATPase [Bacillus pumilus]|uniref:AAA family ATPase n=1 Tax=Bacillus pumilus TaxID=1408 RepID=UPI001642EDA2|nr:AAA family ATPase [Bacillus pumilus]